MQEKEYIVKQMEADHKDLIGKLEVARKETEVVRKTLKEEHQQAMEQLNVSILYAVQFVTNLINVGSFCVEHRIPLDGITWHSPNYTNLVPLWRFFKLPGN